ncbi:MAG: GGDEF domain-containing protein [Thalassotalea sp.]|nr:GGDEF domain-containing protein [Thalassotalea sp.]
MKNNLINVDTNFSLDSLPCGVLVTNTEHVIININAYFTNELCWNKNLLIGHRIESLFTNASKVFYQSYIIPTLLHEKYCEEMQLTIVNGNNKRIPITLNAKIDNNKNVYWSFFDASNRNKLYEELLQTRERLEQQTQELITLASIDELTGLLNRREMKARSVSVISQFARSQHLLSILMIDIDFFKKINDKHGHTEGDRVLTELGLMLQKCGRTSDLVARFGGEEFLILLPDTDLSQTITFTERLHQAVNKILVDNKPLTVSVGVALFDGKMSFEEIVNKADIALYKAKELGRNRTEISL